MRYYKNGNITTSPTIPNVIAPSHETILANGWYVYVDTPPAHDPETQRLERGQVIAGVVQYEIVALSDGEIKERIASNALAIQEEKINEEVKKIVIEQANQITEPEKALEKQALFPLWEAGKAVRLGERFQDFLGVEMVLWEVIQPHTTQSDWRPSIVPALFKRVLPADAPKIWVAGVSVVAGETWSHLGIDYEVIQSHTTQLGWEPPNVPALWKKL